MTDDKVERYGDPCPMCRSLRWGGDCGKCDVKGDGIGQAESAELHIAEARETLTRARTFIEYARYVLEPGAPPMRQFPSQDDADSVVAVIDAVLASANDWIDAWKEDQATIKDLRRERDEWRDEAELKRLAFLGMSERLDAMAAYNIQHWEPIEAAPTDGTYVFVFAKAHQITPCNMDVARWAKAYDGTNAGWYGGSGRLFPTHWMPLPAPPESV
jgi:hypothetical protein